MSEVFSAYPTGDQCCRACGLSLVSHRRCLGCGILIGPLHVETALQFGLCSTCAKREPWLGIGADEWPRTSQAATSRNGKHRRGTIEGQRDASPEQPAREPLGLAEKTER
jgi:hypothetical protein